MLDREPFLKAIFADPANDLPRLVFADFLDDHGDHTWAEQIRVRCQLDRTPGDDPATAAALHHRELELLNELPPGCGTWFSRDRVNIQLSIPADLLLDPDGLRRLACGQHPDWYGATRLTVDSGRITDPLQIETLLRSPVTEHVTDLTLAGREEHLGTAHDERLGIGLIDFVLRPAITPRMVEHLCGLREARRLVALDLTNNDLDNDAVRALARSNYLTRLRDLAVQDGNPRVKGAVWSELLGRFDEGVVR